MTYSGINFRATAGFVTDDAEDTYCLCDLYPTTRGGKTFGWLSVDLGNSRDRTVDNGPKLAGINFVSNVVETSRTFRFDLPNGPGVYNIRLAAGDTGFGQEQYIVMRDGDRILATIAQASGPGAFVDATGVERPTPGAWSALNASLQATFAGSALTLQCGHITGGGTQNTTIAHLALEQVGVSRRKFGGRFYQMP